MRNLVPPLLVSLFIIGFGFSAHANANGHHKRHLRVLENSYETTYWRYRTSLRGSGPPPYAATNSRTAWKSPLLFYASATAKRLVATDQTMRNCELGLSKNISSVVDCAEPDVSNVFSHSRSRRGDPSAVVGAVFEAIIRVVIDSNPGVGLERIP